MSDTSEVLMEVLEERGRQESTWGQQDHDPFTYLAILGEEVGEANKAAVDANNWRNNSHQKFQPSMLLEFRKELIQVAAVAVAMVECIDRDKWDNLKAVRR